MFWIDAKSDDEMEARLREGRFMGTAYTHTPALPVPTLPVGIDPHWLVWNDERCTNEEHTFVYEISWIPKLGVWRFFLHAWLDTSGRRSVHG